jgi:hypothetical protein
LNDSELSCVDHLITNAEVTCVKYGSIQQVEDNKGMITVNERMSN